MQIIKNGEIVDDNWLHLDDETAPTLLSDNNIIISLAHWQANQASLADYNGQLGLRLSGDDPLEDIVADLAYFSIIVLNFPAFTDGRCYSLARLLRDRYHYKGDIRAQGDILHDQLFYMAQCGITSFELADPTKLIDAMAAFDDFSESYQATVLKPEPLYRRR